MNKVIHNGEIYLLYKDVIEGALVAEKRMSREAIEEELSPYICYLDGFRDVKFIKEEDNTFFISHTIHTSLEGMLKNKGEYPVEVIMDRFDWLKKILR